MTQDTVVRGPRRNARWMARAALSARAALGAMAAMAVALALAPAAVAQGTGSIEFSVLLTPTMGRPEPARQTPVLLLARSFADIRKEAQESLPEPDLEEFIASLEVTPELKEWMKRTKVVNLSGQEFMRALKNDDIIKVPEFLEAYLARNAVDVAVGFPKPKYKESDREKDPVKYERQRQDYKDGIRKFMDSYPHSRDGMDLHLVNVNTGQRWARRQAERLADVQRRALEWAHTRYLVARAETDLQGRAGFVNVPAGEYWLSTLDREVAAGDVRFRWDAPVRVRAGQVTRIELNNYNAAPREAAAQ